MSLEELGYNDTFRQYRESENLKSFDIARVILEHKERYVVKTASQELEAEIIGNFRHTAQSRKDFPAVGDWVAISSYDDGKALIHKVLPRITVIERQAVGKHGEKQIIATNIDFGLIVQAVDIDFNLNRLERYLTICNASNVEPIIVLSKVDLIAPTDLEGIIARIKKRISNISILYVSSESIGFTQVSSMMQAGKTYCLLGSSGVGKSTLLNNLIGVEAMKTSSISTAVNKGKHTTSHRELIVLKSGGILIDNPGMREVGITDTDSGLNTTFETVLEYGNHCRYKDCSHTVEQGCAVIKAVENEELSEEVYLNFLKMEREKVHFESELHEKRKKQKDFGKMIKEIKKHKKDQKF